MSGWIGRLFGGLFGAKKASLATSAALMNNAAGEIAAPPAQPQKTAKAARAAADAPAVVKAAPVAVVAAQSAPAGGEEPVAQKAPKKRAPRKRKVAEAAPAPDAGMEESLTAGPSAKEVATKFAPQSPSTERDVWFSDAVVWTLNGEWTSNQAWSPPPSSEGPKRLEEFREKAAEGKLVIWGRAGTAGMWEPIEAAFWKSCGFEPFSFLEGRENVFTEPKTAAKPKPGKNRGSGAEKYCALMVSKRQVEAIWHPDTLH